MLINPVIRTRIRHFVMRFTLHVAVFYLWEMSKFFILKPGDVCEYQSSLKVNEWIRHVVKLLIFKYMHTYFQHISELNLKQFLRPLFKRDTVKDT
jgi:hypothetical protein